MNQFSLGMMLQFVLNIFAFAISFFLHGNYAINQEVVWNVKTEGGFCGKHLILICEVSNYDKDSNIYFEIKVNNDLKCHSNFANCQDGNKYRAKRIDEKFEFTILNFGEKDENVNYTCVYDEVSTTVNLTTQVTGNYTTYVDNDTSEDCKPVSTGANNSTTEQLPSFGPTTIERIRIGGSNNPDCSDKYPTESGNMIFGFEMNACRGNQSCVFENKHISVSPIDPSKCQSKGIPNNQPQIYISKDYLTYIRYEQNYLENLQCNFTSELPLKSSTGVTLYSSEYNQTDLISFLQTKQGGPCFKHTVCRIESINTQITMKPIQSNFSCTSAETDTPGYASNGGWKNVLVVFGCCVTVVLILFLLNSLKKRGDNSGIPDGNLNEMHIAERSEML